MQFGNYIIRLISKEDAVLFFKLICNNTNRLNNYLPKTTKANSSLEFTKIYIDQKIHQAEAKENFCFVLEDIITKDLVGAIFLKSFDWSVPKCELAYFIDKNHEGKGVISKALKEIIDYCFSTLKLNKLFLRTAMDNEGSKKVAEKNGFVQEGILRKDFMTKESELIDVIYYGLVNEKIEKK